MLKTLTLAATLALGAALPAAAQDRVVVAPDSYPMAYFAQALGGDAVEIRWTIPEGADPAFWVPSLSEMAGIQAADVIALNGAGFAEWTARAALPRRATVTTTRDMEDRFIQTEAITHSHGDGDRHSHDAVASQTWLDFALAADQADVLADFMARRVDGLAEPVAANREGLRDDLMALDARAEEIGAAVSGTVLATHPVYAYFARAYGLSIESLEWEPGAMPTADQWDALAALQADTGATLMLWEAAPPDAAIARASEMGLASVVFPPLASPPATGDFLSVMSASLDALEAAAR